MRSITEIKNEVLTVEEWTVISSHIKKLYLYKLLHEVGYNTQKMMKVTYSYGELHERIIAAIRTDKLEIQKLRKQLEREKDNYIKNLDTMFETLRELKGNIL